MVLQRADLGRLLAGLVAVVAATFAAASSTARIARADAGAGPAAADLAAPQFSYPIGGMTGWDLSWPQCANGERPQGLINFAVIGVNGGKMFTKNDCLGDMFRWATAGRSIPQVYLNTNGLPGDWTSTANTCAKTDLPCQAYSYGYEGAAFAQRYAKAQGVDPLYWWLDVETGNAWTNDHFLNERVVRGAIEYLQATNHVVGIYSTPRQWGIIAGTFAPGLLNWTAGAANLAEAAARCSDRYAFGGGRVAVVQYISEHFDASYICPGTGIGRRALLPALAAEH